MRSRYCAYVLGLNEYIEHTWHGSTRPNLAELGDESGATKWLGLTIEQAYPSSEQPNTEAFVQFTARYKVGGAGAVRMRELSRFVREQEQWYYIDGVFLDEGRTK